MTIHFHGGPIWAGKGGSNDELIKALYRNGGAFVSFARPGQLKKISLFPSDIRLDNGAYSDWDKARKKQKRVDWNARRNKFYDFVGQWYSRIEWFLIPDVIEGTEEENDAQLNLVPAWLKPKAVPVWHSDESIERLIRLAENYEWVAIGCCGPHRTIRTPAWEKRMNEAFSELYIKRNIDVKIHGLRMLDGRVLSMYPFASADSTNVAMNVPKTEKRFPEIKDKLARTAVLRAAIEKVHPPSVPEWVQMKMKEPAQAGFLLDIVQDKKMEITADKDRVPSSYGGSNTPADQRDLWRTPPSLFASLDAEFCFQLDAAAAPHNALCHKFITAEQNTLETPWADYLSIPGYVWLNPPYSDITPFVKKASAESANQIGTVMLVPADTSVGWFKEAIQTASEVRFITAGRLAFINPVTGKPVSGNNKGSMLIIWRPYPRTHCHFATVDRDELMAFGAKLLARREAA